MTEPGSHPPRRRDSSPDRDSRNAGCILVAMPLMQAKWPAFVVAILESQ